MVRAIGEAGRFHVPEARQGASEILSCRKGRAQVQRIGVVLLLKGGQSVRSPCFGEEDEEEEEEEEEEKRRRCR